jgi:hypothetical protein
MFNFQKDNHPYRDKYPTDADAKVQKKGGSQRAALL